MRERRARDRCAAVDRPGGVRECARDVAARGAQALIAGLRRAAPGLVAARRRVAPREHEGLAVAGRCGRECSASQETRPAVPAESPRGRKCSSSSRAVPGKHPALLRVYRHGNASGPGPPRSATPLSCRRDRGAGNIDRIHEWECRRCLRVPREEALAGVELVANGELGAARTEGNCDRTPRVPQFALEAQETRNFVLGPRRFIQCRVEAARPALTTLLRSSPLDCSSNARPRAQVDNPGAEKWLYELCQERVFVHRPSPFQCRHSSGARDRRPGEGV